MGPKNLRVKNFLQIPVRDLNCFSVTVANYNHLGMDVMTFGSQLADARGGLNNPKFRPGVKSGKGSALLQVR